MTEVFTEGSRACEAVLSEANGHRSRKNVKITASVAVLACMLLGAISAGAEGGGTQTVAAAVASGTNTGNGTVGSLTGDAKIPAGDYRILFVEPNTNAGTFAVYKPDGSLDTPGHGIVGTPYNGSLNFTIADGATDFLAGDEFKVNVSYAAAATSGQYKPWSPDATDGSEAAVAMALYAVTTGVGETADLAVIDCDAELNVNLIVWPEGADDNDKAAAVASMAKQGVKIR